MTQAARRAWRAERVLANVVKGLQRLGGAGQWGQGPPQTKADRLELERLREASRTFVERQGDVYGVGFWEEGATYRRLVKTKCTYSGDLERGDVCPAKVDCVALPSCGTLFPIKLAVPEVEEWRSTLLRDDAAEPATINAVQESVGSFADPSLRAGSAELVELAIKMWRRGLVTPTVAEAPFGVELFTVFKRVEDGGEVQRLIFDCRRVNCCFKTPPNFEMGSLKALGLLDLSDECLGGDGVCAFSGDLPDFFYTLHLGDDFAKWMWLANLDFEAFKARACEEGAQLSDFAGCTHLGFVALPMGWCWAPYLAQRSLEYLLDQAGRGAQARIAHEKATPEVQRGGGANMGYLDDFLGIERAASALAARDEAVQGLATVRDTLAERGLGCHKEQVGTPAHPLETLGAELILDGATRELRPAREKFSRLLVATRHALRLRRITPRELAKLGGHWAWFMLLRSELFSVFQDLYTYTSRHVDSGLYDREIDFPVEVRNEFRMALWLAPLLFSDLSTTVDGRVYATDACETGGAVCYRAGEVGKVASMMRTSTSWAGAIDPPPADFFEPEAWKMGPTTSWSADQHIGVLEGRAAELGVKHAVRDRKRRGRRVLFFVDNQSLLGGVRKGRSSSWGMLVRCRHVAAHALFAGLRLFWRYVPTDINVADGPSRGQRRPGVMPPTASEKWRQRCVGILRERRGRRVAAVERELAAKLEAVFGPDEAALRKLTGIQRCATPGCQVAVMTASDCGAACIVCRARSGGSACTGSASSRRKFLPGSKCALRVPV